MDVAKKWEVSVVLLIVAGISCSEKKAEVIAPPPPPPSYSGNFVVDATPMFNFCGVQQVDMDGTYSVSIQGTKFSLNGEYFGVWDPDSLTAHGETEHSRTTRSGCTSDIYSRVELWFVNENYFIGNMYIDDTVMGTCVGYTSCTMAWGLVGQR